MRRVLFGTAMTVAVFLACARTGAAELREDESAVRSIRAQYEEIRKKIVALRKVSRDLAGQSAEGGTLDAYYEGNELRHLVVTHFGETGKLSEEYYYSGGKLIFAYTVRSVYDTPLSGRVVRRDEHRLYMRGGKLIRWLDSKGRPVPKDSPDYQRKEREIRAAADTLRALVN